MKISENLVYYKIMKIKDKEIIKEACLSGSWREEGPSSWDQEQKEKRVE